MAPARACPPGLRRALRSAARGLRLTPVFSLAALLTLGLGVGAATAAFSLVDGAIDRPRQFAAATVLIDSRVLITGGYDENAGPSTDGAWLYTP